MRKSNYLRSTNPRVPEAAAPFHHSLDIQVRFTDVDMLGHINNNAILSYMDLAKLDYFQEINGDFLQSRDQALAVVNINADFYSQSFINEPLQVWTAVTSLGPKSVVLEQRVINSDTSETKAIGRFVMACFRRSTAKSDLLDHDWVSAAEAFEERSLSRKN